MDERIDILALVAPLDGDTGQTGVDLRVAADASSFFALKDLRAEARTAERAAASNPDDESSVLDAGAGKWNALVELAGDLLTTQTKDLEIAGWLCEGATRIDGFRGLADGLALMDQLLLRFWDGGLFPAEDEDGVESRVAGRGRPSRTLRGRGAAAADQAPADQRPRPGRRPLGPGQRPGSHSGRGRRGAGAGGRSALRTPGAGEGGPCGAPRPPS